MWDSKRWKKKFLSQSVEYSMHCINYAKRGREKPMLFWLTLRSRFTLSRAQSLLSELLVVFGLSTLNSNRTNHKLRKKLGNQERRHMSLRLYGIRTRYCALIRRRSTQKVQSVCGAGKTQTAVPKPRIFHFPSWELQLLTKNVLSQNTNGF